MNSNNCIKYYENNRELVVINHKSLQYYHNEKVPIENKKSLCRLRLPTPNIVL